jgi:hypothetical protein
VAISLHGLHHVYVIGGKNMAGNILTINLTDEQQQQIRAATGKNISELNIDLSSTGSLSEQELDKVTGGAIYIKSGSLIGD